MIPTEKHRQVPHLILALYFCYLLSCHSEGKIFCRYRKTKTHIDSGNINMLTAYRLSLSPSSRHNLSCLRRDGELPMNMISTLVKQTSMVHIFIIYDDAYADSVLQVVTTSVASGTDVVVLQYRSAVNGLTRVLRGRHVNRPVRHLFLLCSTNHTVSIFEKIRRLSLQSPRLKWIVAAKEDVSSTLQEVLPEGTQVGLVFENVPGNFQVLSSYVNQNNKMRFKKAGSWNQWRRSGLDETSLFPDLLEIYRDFRGRKLVVATIDNWPFFQLRYLPDGTPLPDQGIDYNVIDSISRYLNFTYSVVEPPDGRWGGPRSDGTVYGMVGMVARSEAHVAIDEITITDTRESVVDFTQPYFLESTTLVSRAPEERARSLAVFYPFTPPLWALLIIVTLLMGPLVYLLSRGDGYYAQDDSFRGISHHQGGAGANTQPFPLNTEKVTVKAASSLHNNSYYTISWFCFNMFRSVVIQGNRLPGNSWPTRLVFFSWYAFCVILYALYAGTLTAYMTKPSFEKPIDSLLDLLDAGKFGIVPAAQAGTSNEYLLKTAESGIFKALWELTEPERSFPKSGHEAMEKVLTDDIVYMSANLNSEIRASQKGRNRFHLARNTFFPQGYGIACFPGAPFRTTFNIMLGRMIQAGLVNKWVRDEVGKLRSTRNPGQNDGILRNPLRRVATRRLSLDHLQGAFLILAVGFLVSGVSLLVETVKHGL